MIECPDVNTKFVIDSSDRLLSAVVQPLERKCLDSTFGITKKSRKFPSNYDAWKLSEQTRNL